MNRLLIDYSPGLSHNYLVQAGSISGSGKISQRRKWQPTPVFLPGKPQRQRNLTGYSPWGHKELGTIEQQHSTAQHIHFPKNTALYTLTNSKLLYQRRLQCRRPQFNSWVRKILWRRVMLPTPVFLGFPGGSDCKKSTCNIGHLG